MTLVFTFLAWLFFAVCAFLALLVLVGHVWLRCLDRRLTDGGRQQSRQAQQTYRAERSLGARDYPLVGDYHEWDVRDLRGVDQWGRLYFEINHLDEE